MHLIIPPARLGTAQWHFNRACIFGVINVTPDSFSDGGRFNTHEAAVVHAMTLAKQGADVLDVGGESTRPGSVPVSSDEECARVIPVIDSLSHQCELPISIDTMKASVAKAALSAGASIVNDISGLKADSGMAQVVAHAGATVILGHLRGSPKTMQQDIHFDHLFQEVADGLRQSVRIAIEAGVTSDRIWIDPGIGFGKTANQSLELMGRIDELRQELGFPILVGPSRKSFIGAVTGQPVTDRLFGTCAAVVATIVLGVDGVRVHDVEALKPAIQVADALAAQRKAAHLSF